MGAISLDVHAYDVPYALELMKGSVVERNMRIIRHLFGSTQQHSLNRSHATGRRYTRNCSASSTIARNFGGYSTLTFPSRCVTDDHWCSRVRSYHRTQFPLLVTTVKRNFRFAQVFCDHKPLHAISDAAEIPRFVRLMLTYIADLDIRIVYIPGKANAAAGGGVVV